MRFLWWLIVGVAVLLSFSPSSHAQDDDDDEDDDGVVEDVPDEVVQDNREKPQYKKPKVPGNAYLAEPFHDKESFVKRWTVSQAKKDGADENIAKYDGKWSVEEPKENPLLGDLALLLKSKAKHHAIASKLDKTFHFTGKPFIVQYEVRFTNGMDCGGAYVKLLSKADKLDLTGFHDKTPYSIMFGPDKCGMDHKLHFIFRHKNPKTGEFEEKHAKKPSASIDSHFTDKKTHLYTLAINPDNTFEISVDNNVVNSGSLLEDVSPPVNPPKEIDDPHDKRPEDWDEREKIEDPEAKKPDDWDEDEPMQVKDEDAAKPDGWLDDEPALIPDPDSEKPDDWDDEMDGEWEAPLIDNPKCKDAPGCGEWTAPMKDNPKYKGKWYPAMIDNPNYKGIWTPRKISNPDYFEDLNPYKMTPVEALGLELWSMSDDIVFDNFIITDDRGVARGWAAQTWEVKSTEEKAGTASNSVVQAILDVTKDRPWLWAVFLVVIVLPIVLIIAYCCISKPEKGIWQTLMTAADQHPWLWAIYVVVLLLPIVLLSICLCPRAGPIKQEHLDELHKKTDEGTPEDQDNKEQTESAENKVGPGGDNSVKPKKSKASLEAEEEAEPEGNQEAEEGGGDTEEGDEEEEEEEGETKPSESDSPRKSPRRRKVRKE